MLNSVQLRVINLFLVLMVFVLHLTIAPMVSLGVDEAHYALYALHPALSYFDHPPLVGWLQMLVAPLGYTEFTLRLLPAILYSLISLQLLRLTNLLYPKGSRWQETVVLFLVMSAPILQLLGWGMVPDWPLILISLLLVEQVNRLLSDYKNRQCWWIIGLLLGLAGLSKYTAAFLPLGLVLVLSCQHRLRWLISPYPWCAVVLALMMILPVLIWNYDHQWASFQYQLGHARGEGWSWHSLFSMQVLQMLCYTLLTYVGGVAASFYAMKQKESSAWILLCFAWPFLLVTNWSSGQGELLPNWPALGWVLLMPMVAHWICECWAKNWVKVLVVISSVISVPLVIFLYLLLAFKPLDLFPFMRPVIKDLIGWQQASEHAVNLLSECGHKNAVLLVDNWSKASRLAWYTRPFPVQLLDEKLTQFDFWYGRANQYSNGILLRDELTDKPELIFIKQGVQCELIDQTEAWLEEVIINRFQFYLCQGQFSDKF